MFLYEQNTIFLIFIMATYTYNKIISQAKLCTKNVNNKYTTGMSNKWSYYFSKALISPNKDIKTISIEDTGKLDGDYLSRQISKKDILDCAKRVIKFVESKKKLPYGVTWGKYKINIKLFTYILASTLVYYNKNKKLPDKRNVNSKVFTKPSEQTNEVYEYFVKVFGNFGDTIDGALAKVNGRGYAYYYDDVYSNKQSIDRIKKGLGVNCTDSCHVFYNIMLALIKKGKYKKVECLHVMCSSGGHVKLRITLKDGTKIIRDPACALSDNGKGYTCNWCTNTPIAVNPSWFMENLNR